MIINNQNSNHVNNSLTLVISFITGIVFSLGLIVSQMVNPEKVIGFLRLFHGWDPSLALVMGGAIAVAMPFFFITKARMKKSECALNGDMIELPTSSKITPQLLIGSAIFGVGWGMLGFCPAPAVVNAFAGFGDAILFVAAMLVGFLIHAKTAK